MRTPAPLVGARLVGARLVAALLVPALLAPALVLAVAAPAAAHAALESSDPAEGDTLDALPQTVSITLNEDVSATAVLRVLDADGERVDDGDVSVAGRRVLVGVSADEAAGGDYRLVYRVVSADGHPVSGEIPFSVEGSEATPEPTASETAGAGAAPSAGAEPTPTTTGGSGDADVRVTEVPQGDESRWAPLWIIGFLVVASALIVYIIRAGMRTGDGE